MRYIGIDSETHLIEPGNLAPPIVCLSWCDGADGGVMLPNEARTQLKTWLSDPQVRLVAHNARFDMGVFFFCFPELQPLIWQAYCEDRIYCTLVAQKLIKIAYGHSKFDPRSGKRPSYSLAACVSDLLDEQVEGKDAADAWRYRYVELEGVPLDEWPTEAYTYALKDAWYCLRLCERQNRETLATLYDQVRADFALHLYSCEGLHTDPVAVEKLESEVQASIDVAMVDLKGAGIYRENGTKDLSVVRRLVRTAYRHETPLTLKGQVQTSAAVLRESGDPLLHKLASISGDQKLMTTYVPLLKAGTETPIQPYWNVLVDSGRTSCSRPNMQNLPRRGGVRECFIAKDGEVLIACDYSLAELCSLAHLLQVKYGHSQMGEVLREGKDLHWATAAAILGLDYNEVIRRSKEPKMKETRQLAKAASFGIPGGLGALRFSEFCQSYGIENMDIEQAGDLRNQWLAEYPEVMAYFDDVSLQCAAGGGTANDTHAITGYQRGDCTYTSLCNHGFQHLTAHAAKRAIWEVTRRCYSEPESRLYGFAPLVFVHDEIIISGPRERAAAAAVELGEVMRQEMDKILTTVPIRTQCTMMRRWYKDAYPVYDGDGNLCCWEPESEVENEVLEVRSAAAPDGNRSRLLDAFSKSALV